MLAHIPDHVYRLKGNATESATMWHFSSDGRIAVCGAELDTLHRTPERSTLATVKLNKICARCRGPIIELVLPVQESLFEIRS